MSINIPYCPIMSAGKEMPVVCNQEDCAWYMKSSKTCCVYIIAHKAALDIRKQTQEN